MRPLRRAAGPRRRQARGHRHSPRLPKENARAPAAPAERPRLASAPGEERGRWKRALVWREHSLLRGIPRAFAARELRIVQRGKSEVELADEALVPRRRALDGAARPQIPRSASRGRRVSGSRTHNLLLPFHPPIHSISPHRPTLGAADIPTNTQQLRESFLSLSSCHPANVAVFPEHPGSFHWVFGGFRAVFHP